MAQRDFKPYFWSILNGLTLIRARVLMSGTTPVLQKWVYPAPNSGTIGAYASAPTTGGGGGGFGSTAGAEGVKTVARTAQGLWTMTFQDNYQRLLDVGVFQSMAGGTGANQIMHVAENTTISSMTAAGGSVVGVALLGAANSAQDPADTTGITLTFVFQNSSAP